MVGVIIQIGKSLFIIGVVLAFFIILSTPVIAATINVPGAYPTIQGAVNHANPGDTIIVGSGTYHEYVVILKTITLMGKDTGNGLPIIDSPDGFRIGASGVRVSGFQLKNAVFGIVIESDDNVVSGNVFYGKGATGITATSGNEIYGNKIYNYNKGIEVQGSGNNISDNTIDHVTYGVYIVKSSKNNVSGNTITNGVKGNTAYYNGVYLYESNDTDLIGNTIDGFETGIQIDWSTNNNIASNNVQHCSPGISISSVGESPLNNVIWLNTFANNSPNIREANSDLWNSTTPVKYTYNGRAYVNYAGNYMDDYAGIDSNNDGIGDEPYELPNSIHVKDYYPMLLPDTGQVTAMAPRAEKIAIVNQSSPTPTITWTYDDPEGRSQEKYQVIISTGAGGTGDLFYNMVPDNGAGTSIIYRGKDLVNGQTYHVRVRVYDGKYWGLWSETSWTASGLPTPLPTATQTLLPSPTPTTAGPDLLISLITSMLALICTYGLIRHRRKD